MSLLNKSKFFWYVLHWYFKNTKPLSFRLREKRYLFRSNKEKLKGHLVGVHLGHQVSVMGQVLSAEVVLELSQEPQLEFFQRKIHRIQRSVRRIRGSAGRSGAAGFAAAPRRRPRRCWRRLRLFLNRNEIFLLPLLWF